MLKLHFSFIGVGFSREEMFVAQVVRVGVIGTGFGAGVVAPAFRAAPDCDVVEVVTPRDDAAVSALCARADVDLISVHSPPFLHLEHVRRAIDAGHAVLCDKPFGRNAEESASMVKLAEDAGVVSVLNFERRYDPLRQRLRALIQEGAIGKPDHFQYSRFLTTPQRMRYGWLNSKELGGGWLGGQGSHLIDACRWLFGEEIDQGVAVMRVLFPERADADGKMHRCDAEDAFVASLRTTGGITAVIDCALESAVNTPEHTVVFGSEGVLEITDSGVERRLADGSVELFEVDMKGKSPLIYSMEHWASMVCDAVRSGVVEPGSPTFADGLACAKVMDQMRR
jgi:predicted dehydrogenase